MSLADAYKRLSDLYRMLEVVGDQDDRRSILEEIEREKRVISEMERTGSKE